MTASLLDDAIIGSADPPAAKVRLVPRAGDGRCTDASSAFAHRAFARTHASFAGTRCKSLGAAPPVSAGCLGRATAAAAWGLRAEPPAQPYIL